MVSGGRSRVTARCDVQQTSLERQLLNDNSTNIFYNLNNILIELNFAYFKEIFNLKYLGEICDKILLFNLIYNINNLVIGLYKYCRECYNQ